MVITSMSKVLGIDASTLRPGSAPASDEPTSPRSSVISSVNTDEMLEAEDSALPVRVFDLEKLVRDQQEEISFLKATVADLQRRLNVVDGSRGVSKLTTAPGARASPQRLGNGLQGGSARNDAQRRRQVNVNQRRPYHHQSTGSLHSDGHSSNSASPVTSPSPTYAQQRHQPNRTANLTKRWSSTSDFQANRRSPAPSPAPSVAVRRTLSGSISNISRLAALRNGSDKDAYNAEEGVLKIFLQGRPISLYVPSAIREEYNMTDTIPAPQTKLKIEWVYGYRGKDCRNNLCLLPTGEMVYFTAAVVVLYNVEDQMQRHYTGHTEDVKCLAVHPNRFTIATGQCCGTNTDVQAEVRVWDSVSLNTLHVLGGGQLERGVSCISFSHQDGGTLLAVVDEGQERTLSVWEWQKAAKITENKAAAETVVDIKWHPLDRGVIMTCGRQHVNFWLLDAGTLMRRQGVFGARERPKYVTCMAFTDTGDLITGDSEGRILLWERGVNQVARTIRGAHDGAVFTLFVDKTGSVVSGGKDGRVVQWDRTLTHTGNVLKLPEEWGAPRVVSRGRGNQLLIGTTRNCILTGDWEVLPRPVVRGHTDEVWAAAVHPARPQFVTGAWDGQLIMWDVMTHSPVWTLDLGEGVQCAAFSPDGSRLAVGLVSGFWHVFDADTRERVFSRQDGTEPIQTAAFSPDGRMVALGSRNNTVLVYMMSEAGFSRLARCTGHSSFVTHLDWSADSAYLRTNSGDYELLYWTAATGRQLTQPAQMRDAQWAAHTCTLALDSVGIFSESADGADVNSCARSHGRHLLAAGDDAGKVKLFSYPANQTKTHHQTCRGHSSPVTHVEFFSEDNRLLSTGGRDLSVLQWVVE